MKDLSLINCREVTDQIKRGYALAMRKRGLGESPDYNLSRGACARNIPEAPARDRFNFKRGNLFA